MQRCNQSGEADTNGKISRRATGFSVLSCSSCDRSCFIGQEMALLAMKPREAVEGGTNPRIHCHNGYFVSTAKQSCRHSKRIPPPASKGGSTADNIAARSTRGAGHSKALDNSQARNSKVKLQRLRMLKHRRQDLSRCLARPILHDASVDGRPRSSQAPALVSRVRSRKRQFFGKPGLRIAAQW